MMKTLSKRHFQLLRGVGAFALLATVACENQLGDSDDVGQGGMQTGSQPGAGGPPGSPTGGSNSGNSGNGSGANGTSGSGSKAAGGAVGQGGAQSGSGGSTTPRGGSGTSTGGATGSSGATSAGTAGIGQPPTEVLTDCATPGPRMVRRLTAAQYRNTLLDIFQDPNLPSGDVLIDPQVNGFHADADAPLVQDLDSELLLNYGESVATWAAEGGRLSRYMTCQNQDSNCRRQFIQNFGRKVHREALPEDRIAAYEKLMAAESTFQAGAQVVVTAMLQSPYLLYRRELGTSDSANSYKLTAYEVASELAYFLTDSAPDDQLLEAAAQNRLQTASDIDREVNRLLVNSANAKRALAKFVQGWLAIDGLPQKAKDDKQLQFTDSLRTSMLRETEEFFFDTLFSSKSVTDLFAAKYTFVNQELAGVYQLGGAGSTAFTRVDLTSSKRAPGILGHAAFLTAHALPDNSSPVQRGVNVRERILCQDLPPVPQNLNTNLASAASFANNRERYKQHSADMVCAGCHRSIDPVGFAFEHYDAFGRYREQENGKPVDATGSLAGMPEGDIPLDGAESLITYLSKSEAVRSCLVRYWSYYAYGRDQWTEKQCTHDAIRREAVKQSYSLKSIVTGISHAPHFTRRVKDQ